MIPAEFEYHRPNSIEEALALLAEKGEDTKLLAGGQSLIPAMRFRLAMPEVLIDINGIGQLDSLEERNDRLIMGALLRETALEESELVATRYPLLLDTAQVIADPLVRQRATVGGNLAHADPANDHPATMLAYGAQIVAQGPTGERVIEIDDFFVGLFESALKPEEILTEIRIPAPVAGNGGAYIKIERKVGDYAVSGVAVQLKMEGNICRSIRIGLTNVNPVPMRAKDAEAILTGVALTDEKIEEAGVSAAAECDPSGDLRGPVEYKRDLTRVILGRAVRLAAKRAKGPAA